MTRHPVSPFPRVQLGDLEPWSDPNYIPAGPMRTTPVGGALLPLPGSLPSNNRNPAAGAAQNIDDFWHQATIVSSAYSPLIVTAPDPQSFLSAPNTRRNLLMLRNASTGGQIVYVEFGKVASTDSVLALVAGQIILFDEVVSQDDLYAACDVAGARLVYGYSTISKAA